MTQLAHFRKTLLDSSGEPVSGASYTIYREGATFESGSGTSPVTLTVRNNGKIEAGDVVFINTTTGTTYTVDSTTDTTVVLSGFAGTLAPTALDRIIPSNNTADLFSDDQGNVSKTNPLTTSSTGVVDAYLEYTAYDYIYSGSGVTTTLVQSHTPSTESPAQVRYADAFNDGGSTTDGIQEAINDLPTGGGTVILSPKSYNLDSITVTISGNDVVLQGSGWGTVITTDDATGFDLLTVTGDRVTIRDMKLLSARTKTAGSGIYSTGDDTHAINLLVQDTPDAGIEFNSNTRCIADRCRVIDPADAGAASGENILLSSSTYAKVTNCYIDRTNSGKVFSGIFASAASTHSIISGNTVLAAENGIRISGTNAAFVTVADNVVHDSTTDGIRVTGDDCVVSGNTVDNPANTGIKSDGGNRVVISGNNVTSAGNKSIQLADTVAACNDFLITGNISDGSAGAGIQVSTLTSTFARISVVGNQVYNATGAGILMSADTGVASEYVVSGNVCIGNSTDGIKIDGGTQTNTTVIGNTCLNNTTYGIEVGAADAASTIYVGNNICINNTTNTMLLSTTNWTYNPDAMSPANVASAATITLPGPGYYQITGTADISAITAMPRGTAITLKFNGTKATNGVVDGATINLSGAANFAYTPDDTLSLVCDGTNWYETGRGVN
jgi:hypothetical protein